MPEPTPDNGPAAGTVVQDAPMNLEAAFDQDEPVETEPVAGAQVAQPAEAAPAQPAEAAKAGPAAPVEGQPQPAGGFDPAALGLSAEEAAKLQGCKTPAEALAKLAESYRNLQGVMGRQAEEVRLARETRERLAAEPAPKPEPQPAAGEDPAVREFGRLAAWRQADPQAANAWLQEQLDAHPLDVLDFLVRGAVGLATQNLRTAGPDVESVSIQAELAAFRQAHADHAQYEPAMRKIAGRLPTCPQYDELYAMAKAAPADLEAALPLLVLDVAQPLTFAEASELAKADEAARREVVALLGNGMAYAAAKELRELRAKRQEYDRAAGQRATDRVKAAGPVAAGGAARGSAIPISQMPRSLEEAFDEDES